MRFKNIITLLIALVLITSCKEEERNLKALVGTWISDENYAFDVDIASSLLYKFNGDGTFSALTRVIQGGNVNDVVGYTYRAEGEFSLEEGKLNLSYEQIYLADDSQSPPADIEDLILTADEYILELSISFENDNSILNFIYPPCPPNASCIANQSFNKLAFID